MKMRSLFFPHLTPVQHRQMVTVALALSILLTSVLCVYLVIDSGRRDVGFSSERLYFEYAGRILDLDWTTGFPEWVQTRIGDLPADPSFAEPYGRLAPYTGFVAEYPPGALMYFSAVRIFFDDLFLFRTVHNLLMAIAFVVAVYTGLVTLKLSSPSPMGFAATALCCPIFVYLLGGNSIVSRFDALPAAFAALGILGAAKGRPMVGSVLIGVGAAIKIWPIFLIPFMFAHTDIGRRWKLFLAMAVTALAIFVAAHLFWLPFGTKLGDVFGYLKYAIDRPMHAESMIVQLSATFGDMSGSKLEFAFGSFARTGGILLMDPDLLKVVFFLISAMMVAANVFLPVSGFSGPGFARRQASLRLSVIALLLCTSTFFSGEYMIWLIPLVIAVGGPLQVPTLLAALVAFVAVKAGYIYYSDEVLELTSFGQVLGATKWVAIGVLFLLCFFTIRPLRGVGDPDNGL